MLHTQHIFKVLFLIFLKPFFILALEKGVFVGWWVFWCGFFMVQISVWEKVLKQIRRI